MEDRKQNLFVVTSDYNTQLDGLRNDYRRFTRTDRRCGGGTWSKRFQANLGCSDAEGRPFEVRNYRTRVANTLLLDNALATMGAGLSAAIGVALADAKGIIVGVHDRQS
jgi:hypothetical protein